ncbi:glycoside hydrolase family 28 protein [Cohnella soli]|uniref:Glycoside hydrolase family 28 protein n=1 Tax=Cohnella soli TaxID=425005 RepID=A0ABW0HXD4_9BACL
MDMQVVITEFGAIGDGEAKDTASLQRAINACAADGGGTVIVPRGRFRIGTVYLQSYVSLVLEAGAILEASTERSDYDRLQLYRNTPNPAAYEGVLCAIGARGVSISGKGRIEGQDQSFWIAKERERLRDRSEDTAIAYWAKEWRPMLLLLEDCSDVLIEGITISQSPIYAGWLIDCSNVRITGVTVNNDVEGPNTDGFHLSSCRNVRISDCDFRTGDDAIAIDANGTRASNGITVTNCAFHTSVNCFRIYTGLDPWIKERIYTRISQIAISNCTVSEASGFINVTAEDGEISDIVVTGASLNMEYEGVPIFMMTNRGQIRNVQMSHLIASANGVCTIVGQPEDQIDQIQLADMNFTITPRKKKYGLGIPADMIGYAHHHFGPYNLYLRHVDSIEFNRIQVRWTEHLLPESWSLLHAEHVRHIVLDRIQGAKCGADPSMPVVSLQQVKEAEITRMRVAEPAAVFIRVSEEPAERTCLRLADNDLRLVDIEVKRD